MTALAVVIVTVVVYRLARWALRRLRRLRRVRLRIGPVTLTLSRGQPIRPVRRPYHP